ncbi:unnamed protein product [Clonostachys rosea]|uniref:Adenine DNA glycosylase n=1 Tax=Bionectria ochroleuca TaxID=29856 RepID=A0ABY6U713_BIOOC|nr:unnamed protein product [Clonostachys rosea]
MAKKQSSSAATAAKRAPAKSASRSAKPTRRRASVSESDYDNESSLDKDDDVPNPKRRKVAGPESKAQKAALFERLFGPAASNTQNGNDHHDSGKNIYCTLPLRTHPLMYHRPILLDAAISRKAKEAQDSLLSWFDKVSSVRSMPWRKPWIDPSTVNDPLELRQMLERRAYEVWISEIMLQQTRVAVVIDYWNRWMDKWPTIHDLAAADAEDVLAAWRGLGYYSRATRIHEAAKLIVGDASMKGLIPEEVATLVADVPGIGPYTAGAISAIVFGRAEPLVDGNVLRVLSRQLGLLGNVKSDKTIIDGLWAAAGALVRDVARADDSDLAGPPPKSDRPGRWGQALMELGSTVCTPKPNCSSCPITTTCRAYQEGRAMAKGEKSSPVWKDSPPVIDIEDMCILCEPIEEAGGEEDEDGAVEKQKKKAPAKIVAKQESKTQMKLTAFAFKPDASSSKSLAIRERETASKLSAKEDEITISHARKFPLKVVKKAVREEATLVCAIWSRKDQKLLIRRRPQTGLLAGLWEFPSQTFDDKDEDAGGFRGRKELAQAYVGSIARDQGKKAVVKHVRELGNVPWLFSHLKLTMYVHLFQIEGEDCIPVDSAVETVDGSMMRWSDDVEQESMGTGMRKCWFLVKEVIEQAAI